METLFRVNSPTEALKHFQAKLHFTTGPVEVESALRNGERLNIIDVRAAEDFEKGHIPGAKSLPEEEWTSFRGLAKDRLNILYCYSAVCHLGARAAVVFAAAGYPVMEIDGGFDGWKENDLEIKRGSARESHEVLSQDEHGEAANPNIARTYDANYDYNVNAYAPR
jgi:rhodanese-related sulfurtransferase